MNLRSDIVSIDEKADAVAWPIRSWCRRALFCLFVWASVTPIPLSWSQEADSIASDPAPSLEFFRMYVPRKEIAGVAKGYLPIEREELNRKLELLAAQSKANAPAVRLTTAKYKVALKEDTLVGDLVWQFESRVDHPAWVSLAPCRLPISETAWQSAASDDRGSEVVIGADRKGELGLVTAESGSLSGQWERRGTLADDGSIRFSFSLPACEQSEFLLELPHHWLPSIRWSDASDASTDSWVDAPSAAFTAVPLSTEEGEPIMQRWRLVTSGGQLAITVMHDDADHTTTVARGVYSQESTYQLSLAGIQCRTDFEFQSDLQVGSQSTLQVTPGAQILEVRSGRVTLNWRLTDQQSALGSRLEIEWPEELRRSRRFLHIQAIAPFALDASAEIPRIVPIGFAWQQHSMTLQVDRQLQIEKLDLQDWRQVHDEQPPTRGEDQRFRFLAQSDAASLKVQVGRRQPVVTAQIGTQLLVRRATLRGTMRVHVQVSEGELYSIPLELAGLWRVDSIDCDPPDRLDTIQFSRSGNAKGSIEIRLSQPVTPNRPLALTVHAQHPGAVKLATSVFRPLSLIGIPVERYVIVDLNDGLALQTRGDALVKRFDSQQLTARVPELFDAARFSLAFADDRDADALEIMIRSGDPVYDAKTLVDMILESQVVRDHFHIRCEPADASVSRLIVRVVPASVEPVDWQVTSPDDVSVTARRLPDEATSGSADVNYERWELLLGREVAGPLLIEGKRTRPWSVSADAALIYLPSARSHQASWALRAASEMRVGIDHRHVKELPFPEAESGSPPLQAHMSYVGTGEASIRVFQLATPQPSSCWATLVDVHSEYDLRGASRHRVEFVLMNLGESAITLKLPSSISARYEEVRVDGELQTLAGIQHGKLRVPISPRRRATRVQVTLMGQGPNGWFYGKIVPVVPQINVPVMEQRWRVRLPGDWEPIRGRTTQTVVTNWRQRLFGPLARSKANLEADVCRPASGDWNKQLEVALAAAVATPSKAVGVTWGDWIFQLQQLGDFQDQRQLWIDHEGMQRRGISRHTALVGPEETVSEVLVSQLLKNAGLVWYDTQFGPLLRDAHAPPPQNSSMRLGIWEPLSAWLADPPAPTLPFQSTAVATETAQAFEVAWGPVVSADLTQPLSVYHRGPWAGLAFALWCIAARLTVAFGRVRPRRRLMAVVVTAMLALLIPSAWIDFGAALFLGSLIGTTWLALPKLGLIESGPKDSLSNSSRSESLSWLQMTVGGFLLVGLFWASLQAEQPKKVAERFAILVPIDDTGKPEGSYDYVPKTIYDRLLRARTRLHGAPQGWLLEKSDYQAVLGQSRDDIWQLRSWTGTLEFAVYTSGAFVELPLLPLALEQLDVTVDGVPYNVDWDRSAESIRIQIPGPGKTQIIVRGVATENTASVSHWEIPLLRSPNSKLQVVLPAGSEGVTIEGGQGRTTVEPGQSMMTSELGMTNQVTIRPPASRMSFPVIPLSLPVEELFWLRIRPLSVVLEYQLESPVDLPLELGFDVDPDLQPLPVRSDAYSLSVEGEQSDSARVRVVFREDQEDRRRVRLRFLWRGRTGVGHFELPQITPIGFEAVGRSLAVSADPIFLVNWPEGTTQVDGEVDAFLRRWGEAVETPRHVVAFDPQSSGVPLTTRLMPPSVQATADWTYWIGWRQLTWQLDVEWETQNGWRLRHVLSLPRELQIHEVTIVEGIQEEPIPYARAADGTVTLFLDQATSENQQVRLRGEVAYEPGGRAHRIDLPGVSFPETTSSSQEFRVFRRSDVLVAPSGLEPLTESEDADPPYKTPGSRWVGRFRKASLTITPTVTLRPNRPQIQGWLVTNIFREDDQWWLEGVYEVNVVNASAAQLDAVRLDVPASWDDLKEWSPDVSWHWELSGDSSRRRLVLVPKEAIDESFVVRFVTRLSVEANEQLKVPSILPVDVANIERYYVLPSRIEAGRIQWSTRGLFRRQLPPRIQTVWQPPLQTASFRVLPAALPAASIDQIDQLQQKPEVWLADISATTDRNGRYQLLAVYDLIRADQKFAQIKLDKSLELIGAELNGRFARLQRTKPGNWEAQLVNTSLPQRLVLLCRMTMPSKSLKAPRLENFTVRRTLWSIYPNGVEAVIDTTSLKPISPSQRESERLLQMDQMLQSSIIPGWHGSTETLLRWYRPWAQRLWSSAGRHLHSNRDAVRNREITQVLQSHREAIESLNADSVWNEIRSGDAGAQWTDIWRNSQPKMAQNAQRIGTADTWVGMIPLEKPSSLSGAVPWTAISVVLAMGLIGWWSLKFELPNRLFAAPGAWSFVAAAIALLIGGAVVVSVLLLVLGMMLSLPSQRLGLRAAASGKTPSAIQTPTSSKLL